ncbi:ester cyclase [Propionibacterium cyclohexanicum]|nr:ester cyclase [Propionibacterium cyclohexanicum]
MAADQPDRGAVDAFYEIFATGDPERMRQVLAPDWRNHPADPGHTPDVSGFIAGVRDTRAALSDLRIDRLATVAQGDLVVCRSRLSGVFVSGLAGLAPTHRAGSFDAMDMHRLRDGLIAETWHFEHPEQLVLEQRVLEQPVEHSG